MARPEDRTTEQRLNRAAPFRRNEEMENLERHPELLDKLPPASRISLGIYLGDRERYQALTGDMA